MRFKRLEPLAWRLSLLVLLGALVLGAPCDSANAAGSLYVVAKVSVDTTAKDAVTARNIGMAEAERRALQILLGRLVPLNIQDQLPEFTKEEVEEAVLGVAVRKEQTSTTRYVATLDVRFNEAVVKQLFVDYAIPYSEDRAASISILPVMLTGDSVTGEGKEGWRKAWEDLDLENSVTPATVLRARSDLDPAVVKAALAGDPDALTALQNNYGYGGLVIAVGEITDGKFTTRLVGEDAVGAISFSRSDPMSGDASQAARDAAAAALAILENRWKVTQSGGQVPAAQAAYEESPGAAPGTEQEPAAPKVVPRNVAALVEFSGLRDWQQIRSRLTQIAGLQALEVNSLSARTASITFDFAGSLDRLQTALGQNGFALDDRNGTFVLRSQ
jgi:hypothetical protein